MATFADDGESDLTLAALNQLDPLAPFAERLAGALAAIDQDGASDGSGGAPSGEVRARSPAWVQKALEAAGLGDGLPLVLPEERAIAAMLGGRNPLGPALSQPLPVAFSVPTWWDLAATAVLAGCRAGVIGLLAAALDAVADPTFNLLGVLATTGAAATLVMVHGPAAEGFGLHAGSGALAAGWPINATLGRAVQLALRNLGLARPGEIDMATHGHPGKFSWLVAERWPPGPWDPFSLSRGLEEAAHAVTVVAGVGNVEIVLPTTTAEDLVRRVSRVISALGATQTVLLLPPDGADFLARHSWDRIALVAGLAATGCGEVLVLVTGGAGVKATVVPGWGGGSLAVTREVPAPPARAEDGW